MEDYKIEDPELKEILNGFSKSTHLLNETINDLAKQGAFPQSRVELNSLAGFELGTYGWWRYPFK